MVVVFNCEAVGDALHNHKNLRQLLAPQAVLDVRALLLASGVTLTVIEGHILHQMGLDP